MAEPELREQDVFSETINSYASTKTLPYFKAQAVKGQIVCIQGLVTSFISRDKFLFDREIKLGVFPEFGTQNFYHHPQIKVAI